MINIVEEDLGFSVRLEGLGISGNWITFHDRHEVGSSSSLSFEVDIATGIDIFSLNSSLGWLVEKFTLELWLLFISVSNIIVVEVDDLFLWNTSLLEDLVSMASISLMSVVLESGRSSNDDTPMI